MDATNGGIDLDVLEMMLDESIIPPPSAIYIIPTNNNPTGMTYSSSRREKLVRLASAHNIIIIADEVYHLLDWREDAKPGRMVTTAGADPSLTISLNSFTKIFSPGLRLGWIECKHQPLLLNIENLGYIRSQGGIAPLNSELMRIILTRGLLQPHLASVKSALKLRLDLILEKVASCPNITVPYPPTGGYFLWLKLLNVASEAAVVSALEKSQGVVVLPGSSCCQPSAPPLDGVFIRLNGTDSSDNSDSHESESSIFFAKGQKIREHPPNKHLTKLITTNIDAYYQAIGRHEKRDIIERIYDDLSSQGYTFHAPMIANKPPYQVVSRKVALTKIAQSIRDRKSLIPKIRRRQSRQKFKLSQAIKAR
ncbi:hypothetical protein TrRE_jg7037 [Triparma retinervis]|uniref:Aminotransferase class I/classII domain-containing protein n=1 Tax=Triparma retinervis TaxID=2557542 RepID=A0A9W7AC46_9STRA|nr:hypothetical protein TrRE_jg7037 [Triparma retinervis]